MEDPETRQQMIFRLVFLILFEILLELIIIQQLNYSNVGIMVAGQSIDENLNAFEDVENVGKWQ